ncbi:extracellular solute-binding protein [Paenibacillus sp. IB182496]|uniref:Extracellular solute-binding protein n=1 Tax=Paenibacillus sabuli TaxID=2772509 RepID=A0A927BUD2_9BACL|nr:extracellular solute-binding protein [Paenibacillus sabuli]MBD2845558.1 extracellular solute-binding protein [Paenibacillus sabuli]
MNRDTGIKSIVLVLGMALILMACSEGGGSSDRVVERQGESAPADTEKAAVELTLAHGWTGEAAMAKAFEPAVERYAQEHDYITLNVETAPGNGIRDKIVTEMAANDPPDVFLHWGVRETERYITNGKIADLTDLIADDPELNGLYSANAYGSATYRGRIYALPIQENMMTFLVNTKMFEEYGVDIPETFDELKEAVRTFEENGLIPFAANGGTPRAMLLSLVDQLYGDDLRERLIGNQPFDDRLAQAAGYVKELVELGAFPEGMETLSTLQALELFNAGMSPMYFQHSWTLGSVAEDLFEHVEVIPFPKLSEAGDAYMTSAAGYFVYLSQHAYEDESKREAAWELVKYLAGPEVGKDLEVISGNPSPIVWDRNADMHPMLAKALKLRDSGTVKTFADHNELLSAEASKRYNDLVTKLYLNEINPEEYAKLFEEAILDYPNPAFE